MPTAGGATSWLAFAPESATTSSADTRKPLLRGAPFDVSHSHTTLWARFTLLLPKTMRYGPEAGLSFDGHYLPFVAFADLGTWFKLDVSHSRFPL